MPTFTVPNIEAFLKYIKELNGESDRGAVLVAMAMIDDLLEQVIANFLIDAKDTKELLSGFNAPLGTLSARILAGYALGLISKEEYDECNSLRKVRNEFAHNVFKRFDDQKVKGLCARLQLHKRFQDDIEKPKAQFTGSATYLIIAFSNRAEEALKRRLSLQEWHSDDSNNRGEQPSPTSPSPRG